MKVTLIGAGSVLWSPKVLGDFYITDQQPIDELCLMDINPEALKPIVKLTELMAEKTSRKFRITTETNLEKAVESADFVVIAIAVGGLKAMEKDLQIPEKYGVLHTVGDTVGPGGHSRLLRSVPVFTDMAKRIEKINPNAWIINISNPLTGITKLIREQTSLKVVGLCAGIVNHIWILKDLLGFDDPSDVDFTVAGIDHCSWFLDLNVNGKNIYPQLKEMTVEQLDQKASLLNSKDEWANLDSLTAGFTLFKRLGYLPAISDRHVGEFFPYFITSQDSLNRYHMKRTSIADRVGWGENARKNLMAIIRGEQELSINKTRDIVVDVINALAGSGEIVTTINYPNQGQIANLPKGSVVETIGRIGKNKVEPIAAGSLPDQIVPFVLPHALRQELVIKAAIEGSRELFISALLSDPNIINIDKVEQMADELLQAHKDLLPQFNK